MKKIVMLVTVFSFSLSFLNAQVIKAESKKTKKTNTSTPAPPPPPPPPPPSAPAAAPLVYSLTGARVSVTTGNDNKEFSSEVYFGLYVTGVGYAMDQPYGNMRNEMKVNSATEFGLQSNSANSQEAKLLSNFQKNGLTLVIRYKPNFFMDAWRIEGVRLTLQFKDQNGNPHPQFGNYAIVFNNASGLLTGTDWTMNCTADGSFMPMTSSITK